MSNPTIRQQLIAELRTALNDLENPNYFKDESSLTITLLGDDQLEFFEEDIDREYQ